MIIHTYSNVHVVQIHQSATLKLLTVELNSSDHLTIMQQYSAVKPCTLVFIWRPTGTNHFQHHCKPHTPSRHWSPNNLAACYHTEATQPKECDNEFATSTWPQDRATCCAWKCTTHRCCWLEGVHWVWLNVWIDFMGQRASTWVPRQCTEAMISDIYFSQWLQSCGR